jgi:hypothetical protein
MPAPRSLCNIAGTKKALAHSARACYWRAPDYKKEITNDEGRKGALVALISEPPGSGPGKAGWLAHPNRHYFASTGI